jgi:hypothetical protein
MKENEAKKARRINRQRLIEEYKAVQSSLKACHTQFLTLECRHRKDILCDHGRFGVSKWPGQIPQPPTCSPKICPFG